MTFSWDSESEIKNKLQRAKTQKNNDLHGLAVIF